ncbi:ArsC/Spx/MgsR family protein, partial [Staphylococcus aureus]
FNTHGAKYRELDLKNKLQTLSDDEKLELLSSDGMLVKRPLAAVSYTHLRAHETLSDLVCRLLLEKKKKKK